jgi:hypothetical protein
MLLRSTLLVALLACTGVSLACAADSPSSASGPRRVVNVNFGGLFAGAGASGLAPVDGLAEAHTGESCSPPAVEQTEVNVNFDGMLNAFSQVGLRRPHSLICDATHAAF